MEKNENELIQCKQCLNEILMNTESVEISNLLKLEHVLKFIQKNLANFGETIQITDILPILDHSIRSESQNGKLKMQLGDSILAIFEADELPPGSLEASLQVLYQILKTLSPADIEFLVIGDEVFNVLMQHLLGESKKPLVKANILTCYQVYARKFEAPHILANLWREIEIKLSAENQCTLQILTTLFDDFAECGDITNFEETLTRTPLIEDLLKHEEHDKRKCAYFLLKKSYSFMPGTTQFWTSCISIFENLEENQSHLILPSLELLKNLRPTSKNELKWLNILHHRILIHNNILVRRWVLQYFLEHQTFHELPEENAFQLMHSLNETNLYNIEGYMLPRAHIKHFLDGSNRKVFEIFSQIHWKAVPLHFWFSQLLEIFPNVQLTDLSDRPQGVDELLLNLASKIRTLQNVNLRRHIIELYHQLFAIPLECMDLLSYVELIKSLYNVSDPCNDLVLLWKKLAQFPSSELESRSNYVFDQRFYEIYTNKLTVPSLPYYLNDLIFRELDRIDSVCHGYLCFLMIFDIEESPEKQAFCQRNYDLDMLSLGQMNNFTDLYELLCEKIGNIVGSKILLKRKTMDFYISRFQTFDELQNCDMKLDTLLNAGSCASLLRLAMLLAAHNEIVEDNVLECLLNGLREHLKNKFVCCEFIPNFLEYLEKFSNTEKYSFWSKKLLELDLENVYIAENILRHGNVKVNDEEFLLERALFGDAKTGDSRIEEAYLRKFTSTTVKGYRQRCNYVHNIARLESASLKKSLLTRVCEMAKELNLKKPRYFAHSKEHRMLTRMTYLLWKLRTTEMECETANQLFLKLWSLLMNHNNQPNVTIIYECLIASIVTFSTLMDNIMAVQKKETKCSSSQEVSIIMLLYRYFEKHCEAASLKEYNEAISLLWLLTMGSSFQTRLYAQLVAVNLIKNLDKKLKKIQTSTLEIQTFMQLKTAIEQMIGTKQIYEFLKDFRFTPITKNDFYNEVMYLTQMPYDEYEKQQQHFDNENNLPTRKLLETAKGQIIVERQYNGCSSEIISSSTATDVQRKLNPTADFMPQPNLISYPAYRDHELYVVACFIDKIPNLGGIARTCEVLGIGNFVMASKADLTKADFKNLSMTAEKTLNIIEVKPMLLAEFLIQKKSEGFSIIGAEQTANSCSFVEFKFPKRSVLLLGHEKEGIPPNFLGFLDFAVEIPQFGMVRSLNVHVTGALFMWEYCKQHIYKTNLLKNES